ncbi:prolyl oligopeptidase family serine peptidase [Paenibacillus sp. GYB004]|uniref:alpha/beta fold hydrolase n=1 Tax=Paenibacillus sp. GYB004 TaxID=2994393 RepID=UPI002F9628B5
MSTHIKFHVGDIPCLEFTPTSPSKSTILLYHGWASNIENYNFFGSLVASWGYRVIIPELPYHGERGELNYFDDTVLEDYFWEVVLQGIQEVGVIASEISTTQDQIGIVGHSCGGFIAAGAFSNFSRIAPAVVINGSCAWTTFEDLYREKKGIDPMCPRKRLLVETHDPVSHLKNMKSKALLMLHGKDDTTIPIDSQRHFMSVMPNKYAGNLELVEYAGVNHQITIGMLQKCKEWFDNHLSGAIY